MTNKNMKEFIVMGKKGWCMGQETNGKQMKIKNHDLYRAKKWNNKEMD